MTNKCFRGQVNSTLTTFCPACQWRLQSLLSFFFFFSWLLKEVGQLINTAAAPPGHSKCDRCLCQQEGTPKWMPLIETGLTTWRITWVNLWLWHTTQRKYLVSKYIDFWTLALYNPIIILSLYSNRALIFFFSFVCFFVIVYVRRKSY